MPASFGEAPMNRLEINRSEIASGLGPVDLAGARGARNAYDGLAGSALLRRTGKAAAEAAFRGDQGSALLSTRRKNGQQEDRLGAQLRDFYSSKLREPVPERLIALVEALAAKG
jgi:hypothetical protein